MIFPFRKYYFLFEPPLLLLELLDDLELLLDDELLLLLLPLDDERTLLDELLLDDEERDLETLLLFDEDELLLEPDRTVLDFLLGLVDFFTVFEPEELESFDFSVERLDLFIRTIFLVVVFDPGFVR